MTSFETASNVNPRPGNGSANVYDLFSQLQQQGSTPYGAIPQQQQQPFYQTPFTQQRQPFFQQQPYFQQPGFQQFGAQGFQPFQQFQQQPFNVGAQWQSPWASQWQQNPYMQMPMQTPFAAFGAQQGIGAQQAFGAQPGIAPVITQRSAELKLKIPVHRLIGRHPQEIQQYLLQVVVPVLLDGIAKRSLNPELGLTVSTDLRGETVVEIDI